LYSSPGARHNGAEEGGAIARTNITVCRGYRGRRTRGEGRTLLTEQERLVSSIANPEARARLAVIATELRALSVSIATARARAREARLITHNAKVIELQPRLTTLQRKIAKMMATLRQDRREEMRLLAEIDGGRRA